jgi:iron(III) transport system permease protein
MVVVGAIIAWLVVPPLIFIVQTSLSERGSGAFTLDNYLSIFGSITSTWSIFASSIIFSAGSAALALTLGTLLAWLAERTNTPFRGLVYVAAFVSFAIPPIVKIIGWILLIGPRAGLINVWARDVFGMQQPLFDIFSMAGMIVIEAVLWTPFVFLLMSTPFRSMDPALEESAATSGANTWQTFRHVTFRLAWPSVLSVLLLTFVRSLEAFEVPALLGIPGNVTVLTTQVYLETKSGILPQYGEASAYGVLLIVLVAGALYPYYMATRQTQKYATITGKAFRPRLIRLGRWRYLTAALMLVLAPLTVLLPVLVLLWASFLPFFKPPSLDALQSLTFNNYPAAFANTNVSKAVVNSLIVSISSATGTMLLTLIAAWLVLRTRIRARWALDVLATLPLVFPGVVMGIAVLRTYLTVPIPIYGTVWILVVAYMGRFLPFAMRYCYSGLINISRELEESAWQSGATWWTTLWRIVVPLMMPALFAGWINLFLITVRELTVALLLYSPGSQVIAITFWELWGNGQVPQLAAFSVTVCIGLVLIAIVFHRLSLRIGLNQPTV